MDNENENEDEKRSSREREKRNLFCSRYGRNGSLSKIIQPEHENKTLNVPSPNDLKFLAGAKKAYETRELVLKVLESLPREKYRRLEIAAIRALPSYRALLRDVVGLLVACGKLDVEKILLGEDDDE
jgi:hypothetical protein